MSMMASQITGNQLFVQMQIKEKHQSPASLAFVRGNSPLTGIPRTKGPVTRKMFPFDDIMLCAKLPKEIILFT